MMQESVEEPIVNEGGLESSKREVELSPAVNKEDPMSLTIKSENKNMV